MTVSKKDKLTELKRYDQRAAEILAQGLRVLGPDGALGVEETLRAPYLAYERAILARVHSGSRVLDVCCGNGLHSLIAAPAGAQITVSDIAPHNVTLAIARGERAGLKVTGIAADAESLPFAANSFDLVSCAGSLSYVDMDRFMAEVCRVLTPNGVFVCVDSLNHNPIYRLNRYVNYLRGQRSLSVIRRIPTLSTIRQIKSFFPMEGELSFHGAFSFLVHLFRPVFGCAITARMLDRLDLPWKPVQMLSFKFVFAGRKALEQLESMQSIKN